MRNQSGHGEYKVFEMTKRCSSDDGQSTSLHSQSDGESIVPKSKRRLGSVDRPSLIVAALSLIVSIVFLVIALVICFQVKADLEKASVRPKKNHQVHSNQSDALVATVKQLKLENQQYFSNIAMQLQELYQADANQTRRLTTLENWKRNESARLDGFLSEFEEIKDANSNNTAALLVETVERIRQDSILLKKLQDESKLWNSSQSSVLTQLAHWQPRNDVNETGNQSFQSMQDDVANLTRIVNLLGNHWRGDPTKLLYRRFDQRVTYQTAVSRCKSAGGNIAAKVLRDVDLVRDMITYGYLTKIGSVWIGYHANAGERIWRWTDGGTTNARTTRWNAGEPNDFGEIEDCAEANMATSESIGINDLECTLNRGYLCEMIMN